MSQVQRSIGQCSLDEMVTICYENYAKSPGEDLYFFYELKSIKSEMSMNKQQ